MLVHNCAISPIDVSYFFSTVDPVKQLFTRYNAAIFYCRFDGYLPTDPWTGFNVWGDKLNVQGGNIFILT